jgi:hypothetical protein
MQTFRHWSRVTPLAVVVLIVANRPAAAQSLASASVASWQRSLSDVHSGQAVRLGLIHRGRTEGRWVEVSSPQPDSMVISLASPTGVERRVAFRSVDTLWVRGRATRRGAIIGGVTAAALMGGMYVLLKGACAPGTDDPCTGWLLEQPVRYILFSAGVGGFLGAGVGTVFHQWHRRYP